MNAKQIAAEKAVEYVQNNMIIGLGTGTTAYWAIQKIAQRVKEGLHIQAVASSKRSEELAVQSGIPLTSFEQIQEIDLTIDGADEVDQNHNLIKGGGGALLREKILAFNSRKLVIVVDGSKLVTHLGRFPLPVEIVPFAASLTMHHLKKMGCTPQLRMNGTTPYLTDNGNGIADCRFEKIEYPERLNSALHLIPGVVECGLFLKDRVYAVIAGYEDGAVKVLTKNV